MLVVSGLTSSLFSVRQAFKSGLNTEFHNTEAIVKKGRNIVVRGGMRDKLYVLRDQPRSGRALTATLGPSFDTWHRLFAQLGATTLGQTATVVTGMTLGAGGLVALRTTTCGPCLDRKMTRATF